MVAIVSKTIGSTGVFSTPQAWMDGAPTNLVTAEKSAAGTFLTAAFTQGESLTFVGSGATGKFLDTDSTGPGNGSYVTYGLITGNPASGDTVTGGTSGATCVLSSSTPTDVGIIWKGLLQNQEFSGSGSQLVFGGNTVGTSTYFELTTAPGASFMDNVNAQTNELRYNASNGAAIRSTGNGVVAISGALQATRISKIQVTATGTGSAAMEGGSIAGRIYENMIFEGTRTDTGTTTGVVNARNNDVFRNCLIVQRASAADHFVGTNVGNPSFYNCTFVAPDDLATAPSFVFRQGSSGTITVQNCGLFLGDSTKALRVGSGTSAVNFTTCYSDISGTGGVTQTTYGNEFQNINAGTHDFRLKSGAAQIDTGTTDATNAPADIVGTSRPQGSAYDVGVWELIGATEIIPPIGNLSFSTFAPSVILNTPLEIPSGNLNFTTSYPHVSRPGLFRDGFAGYNQPDNTTVFSGEVTLSTSQFNDLILVFVITADAGVTGKASAPTSDNLSFTFRSESTGDTSGGFTTNCTISEWWAVASEPLVSEVITVEIDKAEREFAILAVAISGVNLDNKFATGSFPLSNFTNIDVYPNVTYTCLDPDYYFIFLEGSNAVPGQNQSSLGPPDGWEDSFYNSNGWIFGLRVLSMAALQRIVTTEQNGVNVEVTGNGASIRNGFGFFDAIQGANSTKTIPSVDLSFEVFAPNISRFIEPVSGELLFSSYSPNIIIGGEIISSSSDEEIKKNILVEIDLHDGTVVETFRMKNGLSPIAAVRDGDRVLYDPRLFTPVEFGIRISAEQYGVALRGLPSVGDLRFAIDESIWYLLDYHWKGREIRIYLANPGDEFEDFDLIYKGQVDELTHDTLVGEISTISLGIKLDTPLVEDFYDDTFPEAIRGRPKPRLRGEGKNLQPVLISEVDQIYQISSLPLGEISEVRIGGIVWNESLELIPGDGEWVGDLENGTFQLGSTTLGYGVKVDAKSNDWSLITSAFLFREIVEDKGGEVDEEAVTQLDIDAPYLIGFYSSLEPLNCLDALDLIMSGIIGFWAVDFLGIFTAGIIAAPEDEENDSFDDVNIFSARQTQLIPPAYRISIEHSRNWMPETQFVEEISDSEKQRLSLGGIVAPAYENLGIKVVEPRAIDVPVIRSLVNSEINANLIRDRASLAWGTARKLYELGIQGNVPNLYSTSLVDYMMIGVRARVHSIQKSIGGGTSVIQLWSEDLPDLYGSEHFDEVLIDEDNDQVLLDEETSLPLLEEI